MIQIRKENKSVRSNITLTPSKSITNRVLIIQALEGIKFDIQNSADAEDSKVLSSILENMPSSINAGDAGTAFRFLTAFLSIQDGNRTLTGSERMKQRPVGELVNALRSLGADIEFIERENYPPLKIIGKKLEGGSVKVNASESSQFISALLLIAPKLKNGLTIELSGKVSSRPYISMTISLLRYFGIEVEEKGNLIRVIPGEFINRKIIIENDWSSASFWYLISGLSSESEIVLENLSLDSIQGDAVVAEMIKQFGVSSKQSGENIIITKKGKTILPTEFKYDFISCPDLVIPMAVLCAGLKIPAEFYGVKNLRIKESDRLLSIKEEFEKVGVEVKIGDDYLFIKSFEGKKYNKLFHSHNDHRMVMSLAAFALVFDKILIDNHLDVNKSYPAYWEQLERAGFIFELT